MSLPKDPPKGEGGKRCSVTGATSIFEIMKLYGLLTKQTTKPTAVASRIAIPEEASVATDVAAEITDVVARV